MNEIDLAYIVFLVIAVAMSYQTGKGDGIRNTIDYLEQEGLLELDD
tara:strand:- start:839 stop:976 length:138 start_codon:yes stop_codon:yes gene_type:complete